MPPTTGWPQCSKEAFLTRTSEILKDAYLDGLTGCCHPSRYAFDKDGDGVPSYNCYTTAHRILIHNAADTRQAPRLLEPAKVTNRRGGFTQHPCIEHGFDIRVYRSLLCARLAHFKRLFQGAAFLVVATGEMDAAAGDVPHFAALAHCRPLRKCIPLQICASPLRNMLP